jgi:hypothetical protein
MKVENIHGDARASEPIALRGQAIAKVEARSLSISHLHGQLAPELLQNMHEACPVVEKVRLEDPLSGPIRNGVSAGEGLSSVRLST